MFTLHNGDCLQILPSIPSGSIDAIITDLPYGTTACAWDEVIPFAPMWKEVKRVLKPNGAFITTASQPFTSALIMSNPSWFKYEWIWDKVNRFTGALMADKRPMRQHENILVFCQGQSTYNKQWVKKMRVTGGDRPNNGKFIDGDKQVAKRPGAKKSDGENHNPGTIIPIDACSAEINGSHPTQKPISLYGYLVRTYTNPFETVLDIAMGSGTTGIACVQEGREFIGIEKEQAYYSIAEKRIKLSVQSPSFFTPSNNRLHLDVGDSPAQKDLFTLEAGSAAGKSPKPAPRR